MILEALLILVAATWAAGWLWTSLWIFEDGAISGLKFRWMVVRCLCSLLVWPFAIQLFYKGTNTKGKHYDN